MRKRQYLYFWVGLIPLSLSIESIGAVLLGKVKVLEVKMGFQEVFWERIISWGKFSSFREEMIEFYYFFSLKEKNG